MTYQTIKFPIATKLTIAAVALIGCAGISLPAVAQDGKAMSMSELLRQVEKGRISDTAEYKAREQRFSQAKSEQQKLLNEAKSEKAREESRSQRRLASCSRFRVIRRFVSTIR